MVKAKYDKANNINKMKENIVEMVLLELKPQQPFHQQCTPSHSFPFISPQFDHFVVAQATVCVYVWNILLASVQGNKIQGHQQNNEFPMEHQSLQ